MRIVRLGCAVVLLLLGCTNSLLRQPERTAGATPPAAVSAPKPRPAAPGVQVPPVTTPQPARKAPRPAPAAVEPPVEEIRARASTHLACGCG